jgi:hypothetical protein
MSFDAIFRDKLNFFLKKGYGCSVWGQGEISADVRQAVAG